MSIKDDSSAFWINNVGDNPNGFEAKTAITTYLFKHIALTWLMNIPGYSLFLSAFTQAEKIESGLFSR